MVNIMFFTIMSFSCPTTEIVNLTDVWLKEDQESLGHKKQNPR
jgi:hypothetical protein